MKNFKLLVLVISCQLFLTNLSLKAFTPPDEGMWLPMFIERLNYVDMQKMGLKLTPEELYSINNNSLKDAIVNFGNFCTAEVVSPDGLLFTNHHCGYNAIQEHSTIDHDYLTNGFWAYSKSEELANKDLTATFLIRMENVTDTVLANVNSNMTESERNMAIKKIISKLEKKNSEKGTYNVTVKSFFNGNEYYMFVYQTYKDVRLVGAPPSSIGKFGGDTDNWMWPRHTGDFSVFRIYTAPDGSPATYNKDNIPLKSKKYLPISLKGVEKNDFTMIWGYPGKTDRFLSSYGVQLILEQVNPSIVELGGNILEIMKHDMDANDNVRIMYASNYAQIANVWKNKKGESRDLKRQNTYSQKKELENRFQSWINKDPSHKEKYGNVLEDMASAYSTLNESREQQLFWYFNLSLMGCKTLLLPVQLQGIKDVIKRKGDNTESLQHYRDIAAEHFKNYNSATEQKLMARILKLYYENIKPEQQPEIFKTIEKKYKGDFEKFVEYVFKKSIFVSEERFNNFLNKPNIKTYENDMVYQISSGLLSKYMETNEKYAENRSKLNKAYRLFVEGIREMEKDKVFYPDANSTMRMTYGKVIDYYPADAIHYDYYTTLTGVMEKEDTANDDFIIPDKLKELYKKKDFGIYQKNGDIRVCFITDNDITGGNSGSPVLNGEGQLVGLAFDGNWEAMSSNISYVPELQRTISVDIRYVLFIIDKYAGAKNLIDELTIVR